MTHKQIDTYTHTCTSVKIVKCKLGPNVLKIHT